MQSLQRDLFIIGTSGLAREMAMLAEAINARQQQWNIRGFISESKQDIGAPVQGGVIIGDDEWLLRSNIEADLFIGIGFPHIRERVLIPYLDEGDRFNYPNFIHPSVISDSKRVELGRGNAIAAGCVLTCDIVLGDFNLLNLNTTMGHDVFIGNYNVMNPGTNVSGGVKIGHRILLGTGSQILENRVVGDDTIVGAGAVVTKDFPPGETVVGVPAKPLKKY